MAELSDMRARAEAEADADLDRRRELARVEFLRSWVEQNGVGVVSRTLRVAEAEIGEAVEAGELREESPVYRAVEGWMAGTGYWEVWDGMVEEGGDGEGDGEAASAGYPSVAVFFGRGMEAVSDGRSRYLMQLYDDSGGDLAVAQDMSGLSRNQFTQAARRIRAGGPVDGRIAELIDARIEELRVARGGAVDADSESESEVPGASEAARDGGGVGGDREAGTGEVEAVDSRGQVAPAPAGAARGGERARRRMETDAGTEGVVKTNGETEGEREGDGRARQAAEAVGAVRLPTVVRYEAYPDEDEFYGVEVARLARRWRAEWVALQVYRQRPQYGYQHRFQRRVLELELELMEEQGLTLPPDEVEISGVQREDAIRWRRQRLVELVSLVETEEKEGRAPEYVAPYPELRSRWGWWGRWRRGRRGSKEAAPGAVAKSSRGRRSFAGGGRWHPMPWPELRADEVEARVARVNLRRPDAESMAPVETPVDAPHRSPQSMGWTDEDMSGTVAEPAVKRTRRGWFGWMKR